MAGRIRTIKPEILDDERSAGLSSDAWRLWVSMWLLADDHGRLRGAPEFLRAHVFWSTPHAVSVPEILLELTTSGVIVQYSVNGQQYIEIPNWGRHQKVDHPSRPRIPDRYTQSLARQSETLASSSETLAPHTSDLRPVPPTTDHLSATSSRDGESRKGFDFEAVYASYPRHEGKSAGMRKCKRDIKSEVDLEALKGAVRHYAEKCSAEQTEPKYIKQFSTFMNCWRDYVDAPKGAFGSSNGARRGFNDPRPHIAETTDEDLS